MRAAALFVRSDSIYKRIAGVECYDYDRDAMTYRADLPIVAHPPCGAWGRFRRHVERASGRRADEERKCGLFAVAAVQRCGGVIEQPACSSLWEAAGLPLHDIDRFGGYTLQVCQSWFGHQAEKCTWLYIVNGGARLPAFNYDFSVPSIGLLKLGRREREATPSAFALWLLTIAAASHSVDEPFELAPVDRSHIPPAGHADQEPLARAAIRAGAHSDVRPFRRGATS